MGINEDIKNVENDIQHIEETVKIHSLAHDLLQDLKASNKRMFAIIIVVLSLWFATIGGFVIYLYQYDFTGTTTTIDAIQDGNGVNIVGGGDVTNGAESSDSNKNPKPNP